MQSHTSPSLSDDDSTPLDLPKFLPISGEKQRTLEEILSEVIVLVEQTKAIRVSSEHAINGALAAIARVPALEKRLNRFALVQQWLPVAIVTVATLAQLLHK